MTVVDQRRTGWLGARNRRGQEAELAMNQSAEQITPSAPKKSLSAFEQIAWRRQQKPKTDVQQGVAAATGGVNQPAGQSAPSAESSAAPTDQLEALRLARKRAQERRGKE